MSYLAPLLSHILTEITYLKEKKIYDGEKPQQTHFPYLIFNNSLKSAPDVGSFFCICLNFSSGIFLCVASLKRRSHFRLT